MASCAAAGDLSSARNISRRWFPSPGSVLNGANLRIIWDEIRASWGTSWCADSDVGEACRMEVFIGPHHEFWWRAATD